jgi:hypothetical protein
MSSNDEGARHNWKQESKGINVKTRNKVHEFNNKSRELNFPTKENEDK